MPVSLTRVGDVSVLNLGSDENRLGTDWLDMAEQALDDVTASSPTALVTVGEGKFYSNGLDVSVFLGAPEDIPVYVARVQRLLARVLTLPVPTIAAVNGHAFGAGAMLALAHDFRVMNAERGFFCFPEVDIKIPFTPGMAALIQSKLTPATAIESMTTGKRYGGIDAADRGLVGQAVAPDAVLDTAIGLAAPLVGKDATTLGTIKDVIHTVPAAALRA